MFVVAWRFVCVSWMVPVRVIVVDGSCMIVFPPLISRFPVSVMVLFMLSVVLPSLSVIVVLSVVMFAFAVMSRVPFSVPLRDSCPLSVIFPLSGMFISAFPVSCMFPCMLTPPLRVAFSVPVPVVSVMFPLLMVMLVEPGDVVLRDTVEVVVMFSCVLVAFIVMLGVWRRRLLRPVSVALSVVRFRLIAVFVSVALSWLMLMAALLGVTSRSAFMLCMVPPPLEVMLALSCVLVALSFNVPSVSSTLGLAISSDIAVLGFIVALPCIPSVSGLSCVEETDIPVLVMLSALLSVDIVRLRVPVRDRAPEALSFVLGDVSVRLRFWRLVVPEAVRVRLPEVMLPLIGGLRETRMGFATMTDIFMLSVPVVVRERLAEPDVNNDVEPAVTLTLPVMLRASTAAVMDAVPVIVILFGEM